MNARAAHQFTRNRIVFGDMLLNWFLGVVLTQAVVLWYIARLCARVRSLRIQGREHDA